MTEQNKEPIVVEDENNDDVETDATEVIDVEEVVIEEETTDINALQEEYEKLKQEKEKAYDRMIRIQAEYDNFKKRTQKERAAERKYQSQDLVTELLPALDNFERALAVEVTEETKGIVEGITMVYNQIKTALEAEEVEPIKTVGEEFDPNLHHAVMQEENEEFDTNIVTEELQKGYKLKDRVIRAAMVKVNQ